MDVDAVFTDELFDDECYLSWSIWLNVSEVVEEARRLTYLYGHSCPAPSVRVMPKQFGLTRSWLIALVSPASTIETWEARSGRCFARFCISALTALKTSACQNVRHPLTERHSHGTSCSSMYDLTASTFLTSNPATSGVRSNSNG